MVLLLTAFPGALKAPGSVPEMHIPDGFLALPVALLCWLIAVALVGIALRRGQAELGERQVPLLGMMAAFIFAAQMINFPIAAGTSGHLLGGALAAVVLGPWPAILVMSCVIGVQGLLFQDGGLVVMGANILNMGLITVLVGFGLSRAFAAVPNTVRLVVLGVAAWASVLIASFFASLELGLSGSARLDVIMPAMLGVHAIIGLGEAIITVAALAFVNRVRPDVIVRKGFRSSLGWVAGGGLVTTGVVLLVPLASRDPDGLERVAQDLGFAGLEAGFPIRILGDYQIPGLGESPFSTIAAGIVGVIAAAGLVFLVSRAVRQLSMRREAEETGSPAV